MFALSQTVAQNGLIPFGSTAVPYIACAEITLQQSGAVSPSPLGPYSHPSKRSQSHTSVSTAARPEQHPDDDDDDDDDDDNDNDGSGKDALTGRSIAATSDTARDAHAAQARQGSPRSETTAPARLDDEDEEEAVAASSRPARLAAAVPTVSLVAAGSLAPPRLVPIRLDLEIEGIKLQDVFTWDLGETQTTPRRFAELLCAELRLPTPTFVPAIESAVQQQLLEFAALPMPDVGGDHRIMIKLSIHIGSISLRDQFEWQTSPWLNDPEAFAVNYCAELALGGEFISAVAHSIREQLVGHARLLMHAIAQGLVPPINVVFRPTTLLNDWSPQIEMLSETEMMRLRQNTERETRRIRRLQKKPTSGHEAQQPTFSSTLPRTQADIDAFREPVDEDTVFTRSGRLTGPSRNRAGYTGFRSKRG
ncbi:SNF5/INI1 protein [Capsaspora owczarzaki ATCC 30864]|uniref:SNF5/INI1 protein n=1 Tax=Capsaspora owczarzaki (strain ATCC 30864) TaxID=595528 RepID=A0A0D2X1N7_CAPO3|nr:SNF5/INI1 protein [Capsaspora owczarzaki ATCC 30864]